MMLIIMHLKYRNNSLVFYPIVHFIFLVWGVILAFKSVPLENSNTFNIGIIS